MIDLTAVLSVLRAHRRRPADPRLIPRTEAQALIARVDELELAIRAHRRELRDAHLTAAADRRLWSVIE